MKDIGPGIDSEILPRLFTKFASKSEIGGTGLGLYISKSIVEAHRGKIWYDNDIGSGATFQLSFTIELKLPSLAKSYQTTNVVPSWSGSASPTRPLPIMFAENLITSNKPD